MQQPSLEGLQVPSDPTDTAGALDSTAYTSQQKLAVAAGVAAIGAYIGYTLVQSYRGETPQALWPSGAVATSSTASPAIPQIALVNLHEDTHSVAREGLRAWLDLHDEAHLTFPTVMFVEEEEASAFADISGDVRRATLFAHAELLDTRSVQTTVPGGRSSALPPPLCTVVYRSVTEVEGHPLEDWDVDAPALRRWHGKAFVQRHCLGFTVDGRTVTLLMQDVEGVLLTTKSKSPPSPVKTAMHDGATLLRECATPSTRTFESWWPPSVSRAAPSPSMMAVDSAHAEENAEVLKVSVRSGRPACLWRRPLALFSLLGSVLRYNRSEAAVFPQLLSRTASAHGAWWGRWRTLLPAFCRDSLPAHDERRRLLSAPFLLLLKAADGCPAPSTEVLREVQAHVVGWVRHFAPVTPKHESALSEVQREKGGQWGLRVDLTRAECTVVEAGWLLTHVASLLASVGVCLVQARLVAVPDTPSKPSLLYPTPDSTDLPNYWKLPKPSAAKNATLASSAAAAQHPGWIPVELRAEKKMGFVVAHHDLTSL